jgi:hypothetical protein
MGDRLQENSSLFSCNFSTRRWGFDISPGEKKKERVLS